MTEILNLYLGDKKMVNRKVEVFSAGCSMCNDAVKLVKSVACPSCEVTVQDMQDIKVAERAKSLGVSKVPDIRIGYSSTGHLGAQHFINLSLIHSFSASHGLQ